MSGPHGCAKCQRRCSTPPTRERAQREEAACRRASSPGAPTTSLAQARARPAAVCLPRTRSSARTRLLHATTFAARTSSTCFAADGAMVSTVEQALTRAMKSPSFRRERDPQMTFCRRRRRDAAGGFMTSCPRVLATSCSRAILMICRTFVPRRCSTGSWASMKVEANWSVVAGENDNEPCHAPWCRLPE